MNEIITPEILHGIVNSQKIVDVEIIFPKKNILYNAVHTIGKYPGSLGARYKETRVPKGHEWCRHDIITAIEVKESDLPYNIIMDDTIIYTMTKPLLVLTDPFLSIQLQFTTWNNPDNIAVTVHAIMIENNLKNYLKNPPNGTELEVFTFTDNLDICYNTNTDMVV